MAFKLTTNQQATFSKDKIISITITMSTSTSISHLSISIYVYHIYICMYFCMNVWGKKQANSYSCQIGYQWPNKGRTLPKYSLMSQWASLGDLSKYGHCKSRCISSLDGNLGELHIWTTCRHLYNYKKSPLHSKCLPIYNLGEGPEESWTFC